MGAWGVGISSNDTYMDIYDSFFDLYNEGYSVAEITGKLVSENQELINFPYDSNNFWFAIAKAQWECKELDLEVLAKVENIIQTGHDIQVWKELDSSPTDIKKREQILTKFLLKLQSEKKSPRKRVKKKLYNSIFKKGDCLIYKMENGNYGGAFVLTEEYKTMLGINYIATTNINMLEKPSILDFRNAEINVIRNNNHEKPLDLPQIGFYSAIQYKKNQIEIEVVGKLPIYNDYKDGMRIQLGLGWSSLLSILPFKEEYIALNGAPSKTLTLSELRGEAENGLINFFKLMWQKIFN